MAEEGKKGPLFCASNIRKALLRGLMAVGLLGPVGFFVMPPSSLFVGFSFFAAATAIPIAFFEWSGPHDRSGWGPAAGKATCAGICAALFGVGAGLQAAYSWMVLAGHGWEKALGVVGLVASAWLQPSETDPMTYVSLTVLALPFAVLTLLRVRRYRILLQIFVTSLVIVATLGPLLLMGLCSVGMLLFSLLSAVALAIIYAAADRIDQAWIWHSQKEPRAPSLGQDRNGFPLR